jgi:hypothetical protein
VPIETPCFPSFFIPMIPFLAYVPSPDTAGPIKVMTSAPMVIEHLCVFFVIFFIIFNLREGRLFWDIRGPKIILLGVFDVHTNGYRASLTYTPTVIEHL